MCEPNENQRTAPHLQFAQEHESRNDDQWARILFISETCIHVMVFVVNYGFNVSKETASRSQFMVRSQSDFARKIDIWALPAVQGV